jgi:hypothetical protein
VLANAAELGLLAVTVAMKAAAREEGAGGVAAAAGVGPFWECRGAGSRPPKPSALHIETGKQGSGFVPQKHEKQRPFQLRRRGGTRTRTRPAAATQAAGARQTQRHHQPAADSSALTSKLNPKPRGLPLRPILIWQVTEHRTAFTGLLFKCGNFELLISPPPP